MNTSAFQRLISHLHRGGGWGYFWELPTKRVRWWPAGEPAQIPASWAGHNVYFGVNPSTVKRTHKRATIDTIAALNGVFAEFDAKDFDGGKDGALAHVLALPVQPSVIVDSGGGYHCYWLLSETFHIASDEDRKLAKDTQAAWVALVASDGGAKDIARVLRVPGQMNHKYEPARPVEFVRADFDLLYDWQTIVDLAATKPAQPSRPAVSAHAAHSGPVAIDDAELIEKAKTAPKFAGLWAGDWTGYDSQSGADLALANLLVWWTNHDLGRADRLFRSSGLMRKKWDEVHRSDGATYGQMTLERAHIGTDGGYTGQTPTKTADQLARFVAEIEDRALEPGQLYFSDGQATHELTDDLELTETDIIRAELELIRAWLHSPAAAVELREIHGMIRVDTYRKAFDAIIDYAHVNGLRTINPGMANLAERYNASVHSLRNHLRKLEETGLVTVDWEARPLAITISPVPNFTPDLHMDTVEGGVKLGTGEAFYSDNRPDDAFLYSHISYKKRRRRMGLGDGLTPFGATGLTIAAALAEHGPLTRADLASVTGSGKYAIAKATRRMVAAGVLVASEGGRGLLTYDLPCDYSEKLNDVRPDLQTDGTLDRRKRQNAIKALAWAKADPDTSPRRLAKLENKVDQLEGGPASKWIARWKPRWQSPVDLSERAKELAHLQQIERDLRDAPDEDKAFYLECAGYNEMDIALVCSGRVRYMKPADGVKVEDARWAKVRKDLLQERTSGEMAAFRARLDALQMAAD